MSSIKNVSTFPFTSMSSNNRDGDNDHLNQPIIYEHRLNSIKPPRSLRWVGRAGEGGGGGWS